MGSLFISLTYNKTASKEQTKNGSQTTKEPRSEQQEHSSEKSGIRVPGALHQ